MSKMSKKGSVDYQNGVIYIIKNNANDKVYNGSTTGAISKRFNKHVSHIGKATDTTWRFYAAMAEIGPGNFMWEELEKYPCQNKSQLTSREGYWIKHYKSWKVEHGYNKKVEGRTKEEYYLDTIDTVKQNVKEYYTNHKVEVDQYKKQHYESNIEHFKQYKQDWYLNNKDTIKLRLQEKVTCTCGSIVSKGAMSTHVKSKKHCASLQIIE